MVYDALNRVATMTLGNTASARYIYNNAGWLTTLRNAKSDGTILSVFTYAYDNVGNRTSVEEANGDRVTWSYDAIYQLTRERRSGTNAYDLTYTYDATGNRLTKLQGSTTTTYAYDAANRLLTEQTGAPITTYSYDNNGNTTLKNAAGQRTTYTWDNENRMTKLEQPTSPAVMTFTYDGQSFRRTLHNGTSLTKFLNDWRTGTPGVDPVLMETDSGGTATATYTYGLGLVSQRRGATTNFYHYEAIGTTRQLTDSNQAVTDTYVFDAWGNALASTGTTANPYQYVGREGYYSNGQSGLVLLGVKLYVPSLGRFVTFDPARDGTNWYNYARANPVNAVPSNLIGRPQQQDKCFKLKWANRWGMAMRHCFEGSSDAETFCTIEKGMQQLICDRIKQLSCRAFIEPCIQVHEDIHKADDEACCEKFRKCWVSKDKEKCCEAYLKWEEESLPFVECRAYSEGWKCFEWTFDAFCVCPKPHRCCNDIFGYMTAQQMGFIENCLGAPSEMPKCPDFENI